ncbi:MAG: hypothetical protein ACLGGV_08250 [Bacteroidia bacterium]
MKKILYILFALFFVAVSCKKQEVLDKTETSEFLKKGLNEDGSGEEGEEDPGIVETEDEEDKKKKGPKGSTSK